jgi:cytidylate kinase
MVASRVSADAKIRQFLTKIQQNHGMAGRIVAEGRDTGTVVFPDAAYKFYLDARPEERARRRVEQLRRKGGDADYSQILEMTLERDHQDRSREVAPLRQAKDAMMIDTTEISIQEVVERILAVIREKDSL